MKFTNFMRGAHRVAVPILLTAGIVLWVLSCSKIVQLISAVEKP